MLRKNLSKSQKGGQIMSRDKYHQFITANTVEMDLDTIQSSHVVPVHTKDNEQTISHAEFISTTCDVAKELFGSPTKPIIRVSHPIMGRVPEARNKPASELLPEETTLFYERLAWMVNFPSITAKIGEEVLELAVGGVKAYNLDNLSTTKDSPEHFKLFVGFKNMVCTNLCIGTSGFKSSIKVNSIASLAQQAMELFHKYYVFEHESTIQFYSLLKEEALSEQQFAQLLGRIKLFNAMGKASKKDIVDIGISDNQLNTIALDYYQDQSHARNDDGSISLWNLYNLFTGANKSSYIDKFLDRNILAHQGAKHLLEALNGKNSWYIN